MQCAVCKKEFQSRKLRPCKVFSPAVCAVCCATNRGIHVCDLSCNYLDFPSPEGYPASSSLVGRKGSGQIEGTIEEFLPKALDYIHCEVERIEFKLLNLQKIDLTIQNFELRGPEGIAERLYALEGWKLYHIEKALKDNNIKEIDFSIAPIFVLFLAGGLQVIQNKTTLSIGGSEGTFLIVNQTPELIVLPDSYPPLTKDSKPAREKYSYFPGKSTVFYAPFFTDHVYSLSIELEAINFFYKLGFFFPYKNVAIKNVAFDANSPFVIPEGFLRIVEPIRADSFPEKQEYNWKRREGLSDMPPAVTPADPFRDQPLIGIFGEKERIGSSIKYQMSDYAVLQVFFPIALKGEKKVIANVVVTDSPLPVRIYDQLQKLPHYRDFLISYDICNFDKAGDLELELISEIKGYTDTAIDTVTIPALGSGRTARAIVNQCPRFKLGVLEKICKAQEATLHYQIIRKIDGKREVIEQNTRTVRLLPHDMIIWAIRELRSSNYYNLANMIGAWISPVDDKSYLDRIRGKAKEYHPDKVLVGKNSSLTEVTLQVKALYDYLSNETGIRYVNQAFSFGFDTGGQRVLLPSAVVETEAGNCIDLVVLFASLMEGLGINPLVMFTKNHAFLAWGNKRKTSEMEFLECTCLGRVNSSRGRKFTFEEAQQIARKIFEENFLFSGSPDPLPNDLLMMSKGSQIVDLEEVRSEGIFASNL